MGWDRIWKYSLKKSSNFKEDFYRVIFYLIPEKEEYHNIFLKKEDDMIQTYLFIKYTVL